MGLVNIGILGHIYWIEDDINEKHDLDQVVPLKIPIVVWPNDQFTDLFSRELSILFMMALMLAFSGDLVSHYHVVYLLATHELHKYYYPDLFAN